MRRTRKALFDAFFELVLTKPYDTIRVVDILAAADVGRSTFYQHFSNKDDILVQSLDGLMSILADSIDGVAHREQLRPALEHFWENRRFACQLLAGPPRAQIAELLVQLVEERLRNLRLRGRASPRLSLQLAAISLAHGQLALLHSWLTEEHRCGVDELVDALCLTSQRAAKAVFT